MLWLPSIKTKSYFSEEEVLKKYSKVEFCKWMLFSSNSSKKCFDIFEVFGQPSIVDTLEEGFATDYRWYI